MFPWLKPENENYGQQQPNRENNRQNSGLGAYGRNANRQNQSDQDLNKAQKQQNGKFDSQNDMKQDERDQNAYNHSRSENRLNQDKYNPYYDNMLSHNLKLNSRTGRTRLDARNSFTPKSPRQGEGIDFEVDYKHQILEKNKQQYKNFYRDNVSEFQKKQNNPALQTHDDKKQILQMQYQKDQQVSNTGIYQRMSENVRHSVSPQQRQKDYADILKKQIEEKKELQKIQQRKDEFEFQNANNFRSRKEEEYEERQPSSKQQQQQNQYQPSENKKQQNKKNVGFEDYDQGDYGSQNYKSEVDYEALARANNKERFQSPEVKSAKREQSMDNQYSRNVEQSPKLNANRGSEFSREPLSPPENRRQQPQKRANFDDDERGNQKRRWNDTENIAQNLIGKIYDNDEREQQLKKQRELQYYKQLEDEIGAKRGRRESNNRDLNWNKPEKSMLDQLGDNYQRQQELQQLHKVDIANDLQQQIKEKKRLQRIEKEKQDILDRQFEEKVKAEVNELKVKYELEMQGKQLEIKSLRKNIEKKKQEQLIKQGELVLSKSSKSPPRNRVENSPREHYNQRKTEEEYIQFNKRGSAEDIEDKANSSNIQSQTDIHQQARDVRLQKRHEDREKVRDSLYDKQHEYYQNMEVHKEWNPPSFWQYKEKKNMEELGKLKDQLDMQTSLLQNDVSKIKQDAQVANEMKSQAFIDLENLKDSLKRQNMIENIKLRELKQNLGNLGYVQNDYLPTSSQQIGQIGGSQFMAANQILGNQSLHQMSTRNVNTNPNLLNQTTFSQNINNSQLGASNLYSNNNYNNNFSANKYGLQQTDILDKLVSSNVNAYRFEGTRLNNKPTTLDFKLEKRLNNVNLNKAEIQLLEVDNLLNNLRNGL